MIQSLFPQPDSVDVAEVIEHRERIAVFQNATVLIDSRRRRQNVILILDLNDLFHERSPSVPQTDR